MERHKHGEVGKIGPIPLGIKMGTGNTATSVCRLTTRKGQAAGKF